MFFKTLDFRKWRIRISERWEINKASSTFISPTCFVRIPSLQFRERKLWWSQILITKSRRLYWESGKTKAASVHITEYQKGDSSTEKALYSTDLQTSLNYSGDYLSEHACAKTNQTKRKTTTTTTTMREDKRIITWCYHRACPNQSNWKILKCMDIFVDYTKGFCLSSGDKP